MSDWMISLAAAQALLPDVQGRPRFAELLRHGTMLIELFSPNGRDTQGPHKQDELYIVISGHGEFVKGGERRKFGPQDVIFVEAGAVHRFENFSEDFSTWVIFWGPQGGEAA